MPTVLLQIIRGEIYPKQKFILAMFLYCLLLVLGSLPGMRVNIGHFASGLVLHSLAYGGIGLLLFRSKINSHIRLSEIKVIYFVGVMGAFDEFVQSFIPYRSATITDWLVDVSAAAITITLMHFLFRIDIPQIIR